MDTYADIVDIKVTGAAGAKFLLARDWRLLTIATDSFWSRPPDGSLQWGMVRRTTLTLGRTADVEAVDLPADISAADLPLVTAAAKRVKPAQSSDNGTSEPPRPRGADRMRATRERAT